MRRPGAVTPRAYGRRWTATTAAAPGRVNGSAGPATIDSPPVFAQPFRIMQLQHDVVCPTVVGRDPQLAALRQVLARASEGSGRVALIVGEAGVGKSRLLRAMTDEARSA